MLAGRQFSELSDLLASGFAVDRIVRSLARIRVGRAVSEGDIPMLRKAKAVLDDVRSGERWPAERTLNRSSAAAAAAFEDAALVLAVSSGTSEEFDTAMSRLDAALGRLLEGRVPPSQQMDELFSFFADVSRRRFEESQNIVMSASTPAWPQQVAARRQNPGGSG